MKNFRLFFFFLFCLFLGTSIESLGSVPLPEHPRPDFERSKWINLNGYWSFTFNESAARRAMSEKSLTAFDERILVPFSWETPLSEVKGKGDMGWYARDIVVPKAWKGKRVFLVVGAADCETHAWLDGLEIGSHQGGYTPFEFELKNVRYGEQQQIVMSVEDKKNSSHLYGKQEYGNVRGIWQTVYLEARSDNYITSLHFTPDIDGSTVKVDVALAAPAAQGEKFQLKFQTGGQKKFTADISGRQKASFTVPIKNQHLWNLDDPFLYEVTAQLGHSDAVSSYFGQRKISVVDLPGTDYPYIALNNKPVYLQLTLDQSFCPDGFYTFPTDEYMRNEILISKRLGLSGNRVHIKVEVPRKLYWADRLGLLIMADTPHFWGEPDAEARADWEHCLRGQVERDYNHPSIFAWVNFNETWGLKTKRVYLKETQEWVRSMYRLTKSLDPSRLVEDQSACNQDHVETDINSWHSYRPGWDWDRELKYYVDNTYPGSPFNFVEGSVQGRQPMMNSECGNVWGYSGSAGDSDFTWDYHIMINAFRRNPKCAGWLYTEHHDVPTEWNGYVRYDRTPKYDGLGDIVPGMTMADFHSPYYITTDHQLYTEPKAGEEMKVNFFASFMTDKDPGPLQLETEIVGWDELGQPVTYMPTSGKKSEFKFVPYKNSLLETMVVKAPQQNGLYILRYVLKTGEKVLHRNFLTLRVKDGRSIKDAGTRLVTFAPASFSSQKWSQKQGDAMEGKKVNGFGHGYFEYKVTIPEDVDLSQVKSAELIFEASSRELFTRDVDDSVVLPSTYVPGGNRDHCRSANSYAMTDTKLWPSRVEISVNGTVVGKQEIADAPSDHRGILSWGAQPKEPVMTEAGSYGYLYHVDIPLSAFAGSRTATIRFTVPDDGLDGGLAIYGKDFGRYPLDPTLVLRK